MHRTRDEGMRPSGHFLAINGSTLTSLNCSSHDAVFRRVRGASPVTDGNSSDYLLPYPCTLTAEGWVKTASGEPLAVGPTYWKLYVEIPPETKICEAPPPKGDRRTGFADPGPTTGR